jgi:hypothetical protein
MDLVASAVVQIKARRQVKNLGQVGNLERGKPSSVSVTRCRSGKSTTRRILSEGHERRRRESVSTATNENLEEGNPRRGSVSGDG